MILDSCPKCIFLLNILRMNRRISIKFGICIDIYIYIYDLHLSNYISLSLIFQRKLRHLNYVQNVFLLNIFQINGYVSRKFCKNIGIAEEWYGNASGLISFRNNGVQKQQSYE